MEIEREIVVPEEASEVWESLTDSDRLEEWFATEVELDARPGGEGVFRWGDGDERHHRGELVHVSPRHAMRRETARDHRGDM